MTKRENIAIILNVLNELSAEQYAEQIAFLKHEVELLNKRAETPRKKVPSKKQKENEIIKIAMLDYMAGQDGRAVNLKELMEKVEALTSVQHANALMIQLKNEGRVERVEVKGQPFFKVKAENENV